MAYWGYYEFIRDRLKSVEAPSILEIGVDKGQMFLPLLSYLTANHEEFILSGVDIKFDEAMQIKLQIMENELDSNKQFLLFYEDSSLNVLPRFTSFMKETNQEGMFDVILVDGDHNYHTVSQEFRHVPGLLKPGGMIIVDDYSGRWAHQDEYFSELPEYKDNKFATKREDTEHPEKKGVKPAIDEFLENNPEWSSTDAVQAGSDPLLVFRRGELELVYKTDPDQNPLTEEELLEISNKEKNEEDEVKND